MASAPRTLAASESFEDVEGFLEHLFFNLRACPLTQSLAPDVGLPGKRRISKR